MRLRRDGLRRPRVVVAPLALSVVVAIASALSAASALAGPGDLDRSFGTRGAVLTPSGYAPRDILVLPDGRFLVGAGRACQSGPCGFALARFKANGERDESFGSDGAVLTPVPGVVGISRLVRQPDGKLVAVGDATGQDGWAVARYNADGTLDSSFGSGGVTVMQMAENRAFAADAVVTEGGKLVVAGMLDGNFAVARYNPDGSLDAGFGDGGRVVSQVGASGSSARAVVELPDGKLLAAGGATPAQDGDQVHDVLLRYNPDGSLDESFGSHGQSIGLAGYVNALVRQPDGKLITAGSRLARYNADGSVDTSFPARVEPWVVHDVLLQPDGKVVAVGAWRTIHFTWWIVRRLEANGAPDPSFCMPPKPLKGEPYASALRPDGRFLVAGQGVTPGSGYLIRRYLGGGSGPCADMVAPRAQLGIPPQRLGRVLTGRLAVRVAVTEPGRARLSVVPTRSTARRLGIGSAVTLARGTHRFAHGGRGRVELSLNRLAKQRLRAASSVDVRVRLIVADRSGNTARLARRLTLRR